MDYEYEPECVEPEIVEEAVDETDPLLDVFKFLFAAEKWQQDALCRKLKIPLDEFFPARGRSQKKAKSVCARCPVAAECHDYANRSGTDYGIWGGRIRHRGKAAKEAQKAVTFPPNTTRH